MMWKLSLCAFLFLGQLFAVQAAAGTTPPYYTTQITTPQGAAPGNGAGGSGGAASGSSCGSCPTCPPGYSTSSYRFGCVCLCELNTGMTTTVAAPGGSGSLLIKLLSNIASNAGAIGSMANSLMDEVKMAQELA